MKFVKNDKRVFDLTKTLEDIINDVIEIHYNDDI